MTKEVEKPSIPTGAVEFRMVCELGASRQLTIGGYFGAGASRELIDAELDKVLAAVNRQQSKSAIINLEAEIASMERNIRQMREDVARIDAKYTDGKKQPSVQERQHREACMINIKRVEEDIATKQGFLADCRKDAA